MNVALHPEQLRTLSLCSGGGGLDLGFGLAVQRARTVCYVEREAFAAAHLVEAMAHGLVDDAPIWSDLGTFDCEPWRGVVDCVLAGWPCPPYSAAGKRRGADDERDLWPDVFRIVAALRPAVFAGENVAGFASHPDGLARTVRDLQGIGYRVAATLVTAADVGASHERERCFLLGTLADPAGGGRSARHVREPGSESWGSFADDGVGEMADTAQPRRNGGRSDAGADRRAPSEDGRGRAEPARGSAAVVHADEPGSQGRLFGRGDDPQGRQEPGERSVAAAGRKLADADRGRCQSGGGLAQSRGIESECWGESDGRGGDGDISHFPPGPGAVAEWRRVLERDPSLAPALEPPFRLLADGVAADRRHFLRLFGNGVVPLQAAYAFCTLLAGVEVSE